MNSIFEIQRYFILILFLVPPHSSLPHPHPAPQGGLLSHSYLMTPKLNREKAVAPHSSTLAWKIPWMGAW